MRRKWPDQTSNLVISMPVLPALCAQSPVLKFIIHLLTGIEFAFVHAGADEATQHIHFAIAHSAHTHRLNEGKAITCPSEHSIETVIFGMVWHHPSSAGID